MNFYMQNPYLFITGASIATFFFFYYENRWGTTAGRFSVAAAIFFCGCAAAQMEFLNNNHRDVVDKEKEARLYIDVSDSIPLELGEAYLADARSRANITETIPFAGTVGTPLIGEQQYSFETLRSKISPEDRRATNLEPVLLKICNLPLGIRALLATDGQETTGTFERTFPTCSTQAIVDVISVPKPPAIDSFDITNLNVPTHIDLRTKPKIQVSVKNNKSILQSARLVVKVNNIGVGSENVSLTPGRGKTFFFKGSELTANNQQLDVVAQLIAPTGEILSSKTAYIRPKPVNTVLLVSKDEEQAVWIFNSLSGAGFEVERKAAQELTEKDLLNDAVRGLILNNVPHKDIAALDSLIRKRVQKDALGLVMLGGESSFGLGGYKDTEIAKALPVEITPPQAEQKRINVAVQLVLDKSTSMNQGEKIEFARESAREVVRNLKPEDYIGVIGFDSTPFIAVRIGRVGEIREEALDKISRIYPAQSTRLFPALEEARRGLERVEAGRKHIIVLTDGKLPDAGPYYPEFVRQIRLEGITMSTVLIGGESEDGLLKEMARVGGGAFYQTSDVRSLPRIFIADVKASSKSANLNEDREFNPRRGEKLRSTSLEVLPAIRGYDDTKKKEGATLEFTIDGANGAVPLLASMEYGAGRSVAFTSDLFGRWSSLWSSWPKTGTFINEIVTYASKITSDQKPELLARSYFEKGKIVFEVTAFGAIKGTLFGFVGGEPGAAGEHIVGKEVAARRYRFEVPPKKKGPLTLTILQSTDHDERLDSFTYEVTEDELVVGERYRGINEYNLERIRSGISYRGYSNKYKGNPYIVKESPRKFVTDYIFLLSAMICYLFSVLRRERALARRASSSLL
jgi:Mg-chelatase subunit ChlD